MNHSELAHKWAHASADDSRRCGSMSFTGATLYSYATPIARIYRHKTRGALVLSSEFNYSKSTAKHLNHAARAVSHMPHLRVPAYMVENYVNYSAGRYRGPSHAKQAHAANLDYFAAAVADALKTAQRAMSLRTVGFQRDEAKRAIENFAHYAAFFGIRRKAPRFPELEFNAAASRAERIENPSEDEQRRRGLAQFKRAAAKKARELEAARLAFWHASAARSNWRLGDVFGHYGLRGTGAVMLRVNGDEIETSQGARVPLAAAPMVWNLVQRARQCGGIGTRSDSNGLRALHRPRIGDYPLDRIDADGTLHAGCHTIPFSELAAMARTLGLEGAQS